MYKSLFFTAVVLFDGVVAQTMTVDGIEYDCSESSGCKIEVTQNFNKTSLNWKTFDDGAANLGWFDFGSLVDLKVANCDNLQEIDFSDAPSGQVISYPSGGGGLFIGNIHQALPNLHTINLGQITEVGWLSLDNIGTSVDDGVLDFKAPELQTVRGQLEIKYLSIDELRFDALEFIGDIENPPSQPGVRVVGNITTISLPVVKFVHSIEIKNPAYVRSISGLFQDDKMFLPSVFFQCDGFYDGLRTFFIVFY